MIDRNEDPSIGSQHAKLSAGDSQFICEPLETLLFSPDPNTDNREPKLTIVRAQAQDQAQAGSDSTAFQLT